MRKRKLFNSALQDNVKRLNQLRPRFEALREREGQLSDGERNELEELRKTLNDVWGNIVLTEVETLSSYWLSCIYL